MPLLDRGHTDLNEANLALRRALFMHVPQGWSHTAIEASERANLKLLYELAADLVAWRDEQGLPVPKEAHDTVEVEVAFFMVRGAIQGALLYRPELLRENQLAEIVRPLLHAMFGGG